MRARDKFVSYGDRNFLDGGILIRKDCDRETSFCVLRCDPCCDIEDAYRFDELYIDTEDPWLDRNEVMRFAGITAGNFTPEEFAIACTDFYNRENFGSSCMWRESPWMSAEEVIHEMSLYAGLLPDDIVMHALG